MFEALSFDEKTQTIEGVEKILKGSFMENKKRALGRGLEQLFNTENLDLDTIEKHAYDFINKRLKPKDIPNDGKQTPMKGHPVFIAQHATACCCRECLYKWHHIAKDRTLTNKEMNELLLKVKNGDMEARNKMIVGNLKLVLSVMKKFNNEKK